MQTQQFQTTDALIVHDPALLPAEPWLFEPAALEQRGLIRQRTKGRRSAFVFTLDGHEFVLRHYWRGGLIGRLVEDSYLWLGAARSRPLREWKLLQQLSVADQPVPHPAALRIVRRGLRYRADLITLRLPAGETLADHLERAPLDAADWRRIGATIAALHHHGAFHADLNARNILLGGEGVYVIDWDRGEQRRPAARWQRANLARLRRSLDKLAGLLEPFHYRADDFDELLAGYYPAGDGR
jgi:3-deoxy-D-manno-octulosonic acid kinase